MTVSREDFVSAIVRLNDLTRSGQIQWKLAPSFRLGDSAASGYETVYDGRRLRLVEYSPPRVRGFFYGSQTQDRGYGISSDSELVLEILDENGTPTYEFPKVSGIADLQATVRARLTDVEGLIKSLISAT